MRRIAEFAVLALLAGGLVLTGCDEPEEEPADQEEAAEEPVAQDDEPAEEEAAEEPEFDEDMFVLAAYETRCVDQQLEDEDEIAEIREEIYARYGFTDDSYDEASDHFEGDESVELQVDTRMEQCDEERARGFAEEGAGDLDDDQPEEEADDEEEADEQEAAAQPDPEPMVTGTFETSITDAGFEETNLELQIRPNFDVRGEFRGERNGEDFLIPISGEVSEDDQLQASGERGGHSIDIDGSLHPQGAEGEISGDIAGDSYRVRYEVR